LNDLPDPIKDDLLKNNYIGCHTFAQSRRLGSPEFFKDLDPSTFQMARHQLTQIHEGSGRATLYIGAHLHHIEGLSNEDSCNLRDMLNQHVTQEKYIYSFEWHQPGDMVIWDNRATLHRAMAGSFVGKYRRDLRRTTVHDDSSTAWGLNSIGERSLGYQFDVKTLAPPTTSPGTQIAAA
jgi:alpha-ketoglutarate-dependent 2,4-dichlorophenoxyacetate dioxygenase